MLLPLEKDHVSKAWATTYFSYAHILCPETFSVESQYDNINLEKWMKEAKKVMENIQMTGKFAAEKEICRRFVCDHEQKAEFALNCPPKKIEDVLNVIGKRSWYENNKEKKREIMYDIIYGMYSEGNNQWLYTEENEWLQKKHIQYNEYSEGNKDSFRNKGFVMYHLKKRSKNSFGKKITMMMKSKHGEYLLQRNKNCSKNSDNNGEWEFKKITIGLSRECWLVVRKEQVESAPRNLLTHRQGLQDIKDTQEQKTFKSTSICKLPSNNQLVQQNESLTLIQQESSLEMKLGQIKDTNDKSDIISCLQQTVLKAKKICIEYSEVRTIVDTIYNQGEGK